MRKFEVKYEPGEMWFKKIFASFVRNVSFQIIAIRQNLIVVLQKIYCLLTEKHETYFQITKFLLVIVAI